MLQTLVVGINFIQQYLPPSNVSFIANRVYLKTRVPIKN